MSGKKFLRKISAVLEILNILIKRRAMRVHLLSLCTNHERVIYEVPHILVILSISRDLWVDFQKSFPRMTNWESKGIFLDPSKYRWGFLRKYLTGSFRNYSLKKLHRCLAGSQNSLVLSQFAILIKISYNFKNALRFMFGRTSVSLWKHFWYVISYPGISNPIITHDNLMITPEWFQSFIFRKADSYY